MDWTVFQKCWENLEFMTHVEMSALAKRKHIFPNIKDKRETIDEDKVWMEKEVVVKTHTGYTIPEILRLNHCTFQSGSQEIED